MTHHESIPVVGSGGGRPEKWIDNGAKLQAPPMVTGGGWAIPAGEKPGWGLGKVEEVPGKVLARGIEVWCPEEGDRRKGATALRALEWSSPLVVVRRRREDMIGGSHNQDKYLGVTLADRPPIPSGPSAIFLGVTA